MSEDARRIAERAARHSYGRLVALLATRGGDIAAAEDALADAFAAALLHWPTTGVPANPEAWLFTAARRNLNHARHRRATADAGKITLALIAEERADRPDIPFGDDRLKLMFVCAHPAIDGSAQAPLMLQAVFGLDAVRIAASFLISPGAMGQKLVRAKTKIRDARIGFDIPAREQIGERLEAVLAAVYAAYGTGWEDVFAVDGKTRGLSDEAIWLARLLRDLLPANSEVIGLLSLMLYCEARRDARRNEAGHFVPLAEQNPNAWRREMVMEAEALLRDAARIATPARFQIEAAIQSLHVQAVMTGESNGVALARLYDLLVSVAPTVGAMVARACAYAEAGEAEAAIVQLDALALRGRDYQPWWAARARALSLLRRQGDAEAAAQVAAGLSADSAVRDYLLSGGLFRQRPR